MSRIGPQATTMDMVARECGISKRTLYEVFPDKRTLISEMMQMVHEEHKRDFETIFNASSNNFEALLKIYRHIREFLEETTLTFYDDLQRLYPEIHRDHRANEVAHIRGFAQVIETAKSQGLVKEEVNSEIAAIIFMSTMSSLKEGNKYEEFNYTKSQLIDATFINFLRGIATIDGINYIENFLLKQ